MTLYKIHRSCLWGATRNRSVWPVRTLRYTTNNRSCHWYTTTIIHNQLYYHRIALAIHRYRKKTNSLPKKLFRKSTINSNVLTTVDSIKFWYFIKKTTENMIWLTCQVQQRLPAPRAKEHTGRMRRVNCEFYISYSYLAILT